MVGPARREGREARQGRPTEAQARSRRLVSPSSSSSIFHSLSSRAHALAGDKKPSSSLWTRAIRQLVVPPRFAPPAPGRRVGGLGRRPCSCLGGRPPARPPRDGGVRRRSANRERGFSAVCLLPYAGRRGRGRQTRGNGRGPRRANVAGAEPRQVRQPALGRHARKGGGGAHSRCAALCHAGVVSRLSPSQPISRETCLILAHGATRGKSGRARWGRCVALAT